MRTPITLSLIALALAAGFVVGQTTRPVDPNRVTEIAVPFKLPAIGYTDSVTEWTFGRIERVERRGANNPDLVLHIRTNDGVVSEVWAPRAPMAELARWCNWIEEDPRQIAGSRDVVERLIAFSLDNDGRLAAAVSLEPMNRSRTRLRRAFCR